MLRLERMAKESLLSTVEPNSFSRVKPSILSCDCSLKVCPFNSSLCVNNRRPIAGTSCVVCAGLKAGILKLKGLTQTLKGHTHASTHSIQRAVSLDETLPLSVSHPSLQLGSSVLQSGAVFVDKTMPCSTGVYKWICRPCVLFLNKTLYFFSVSSKCTYWFISDLVLCS